MAKKFRKFSEEDNESSVWNDAKNYVGGKIHVWLIKIDYYEELATFGFKDIEGETSHRNQLATEVAQLETVRKRHETLNDELGRMTHRRVELETTLAASELKHQQIQQRCEALEETAASETERLEQTRLALQSVTEKHQALATQVAELTVLEEKQQRLRNQLEQDQVQRLRLQEQLALSRTELAQVKHETEMLDTQAETTRQTLEQLHQRIETLRQEQTRLDAETTRRKVEHADHERQANELNDRLTEVRSELAQQTQELHDTRQSHASLSETVQGLTERRRQLQATIETLTRQLQTSTQAVEQQSRRDDPWRELREPVLIGATFISPREETDEAACLEHVGRYLTGLGLRFPDRVIHAFHTTLKVADIAPLVVLAGPSGSGKSELPRRYAQAMGMHFINQLVQPRWDNPEHLLGRYLHEDGGFHPTALARALTQMDRFAEQSNRAATACNDDTRTSSSLTDRMLLVLIDELAAAPPEFYLGQLLNRLAARRGVHADDDTQRQTVEITLEGGAGLHGPSLYRMFIDTNVLFTAAMSLSPTTPPLSEKILDRANVLPLGLPPAQASTPGETLPPPDHYLAFQTWRTWTRTERELSPQRMAVIDHWLRNASDAMALLRQPLSPRSQQAIRAYLANYPDQSDQGAAMALADQIELRMMPRLSSLDPTQTPVRQALQRLTSLSAELGDDALAEAIEGSRRDGARDQWFVYHPADRWRTTHNSGDTATPSSNVSGNSDAQSHENNPHSTPIRPDGVVSISAAPRRP